MSTKNNNLLQYEPLLTWSPKEATDKLLELYKAVLAMTDSTIAWYHTYRSKKGWWAKTIRVISIVLLVVSTLMPLLASVTGFQTSFLYTGYIIAGVGGGLLLLDKYYGLSNSWIRFVLTGMDLENMRNIFVENWQVVYVNKLPLTKESFAVLVNAIMHFQLTFNSAVKAETETWAREFEQNFKELISKLQESGDQIKAKIEENNHSNAPGYKDTVAGHGVEPVPTSVIHEAIDLNFETWKSMYNVVAVSSGTKISNGNPTDIDCLVFTPALKLDKGAQSFNPIPAVIRFESTNGQVYNIPTDVRAGGSDIRASGGPALICDSTVPKRPGCSISRMQNGSTGTLGLKVFKNGKPYLLGCYHVLCAPELNDGQFVFAPETSFGDTSIVSPGMDDAANGMKLGNVTEGILNDQLDCALAFIRNPVNVSGNICSVDSPPGLPLTVTPAHARERYPVRSIGRTSGIIDGRIQHAYTHCDVHYLIHGTWQIKTLKGVICTDQLCTGGDSGAPVVDHENNIIGIIIACSRQFTYIIPIEKILSKFSITLK